MRRCVALLCILCLVAGGLLGGGLCALKARAEVLRARRDAYRAFAQGEAEWLCASQLSNGALPYLPAQDGEVYLNPCFSLSCALALAEYGGGDAVAAVRRYLDWHFQNMNIAAPDALGAYYTICDAYADVEGGVVVSQRSTGSYDSADAYGALLFTVMLRYHEAGGDTAFLLRHYDKLEGVVALLESLRDGALTMARPDYAICYLMDNCEVFAGLGSALALLDEVYLPAFSSDADVALAARALRARVAAMRDALAAELESRLWNEAAGRYEYGIQAAQVDADFDWSTLYPDAMSQLSPAMYSVIPADSARAQQLYTAFNQHVAWQEMEHVADGRSLFYCSIFAYAAALCGDCDSVERYLAQYAVYVLPERAYPFYNDEAAYALRAALACADAYDAQLKKLDPLGLFA